MRKACEGKVVLPTPVHVSKVTRSEELLPTDHIDQSQVLTIPFRNLDESDANHIYLAEIDNPDRMFVILTDQHDRYVHIEKIGGCRCLY